MRIGTSGWVYSDWRARFYPKKLPHARWLSHYADHFDTVEINGSFYRLPEATTFEGWREQVPAGFCFAVKFSRFGTHMKRLLGAKETIGRFLERAIHLGPRLGPILVQLPPRFHADPERLDEFLSWAPADFRWAVEVRDPSWLCEPVYDVLARQRVALVVHDLLPNHPDVPTTNWSYYRFHGVDYGGHYDERVLASAARAIRRKRRLHQDVYAYFNNDKRACAIGDAKALRAMVLGERAAEAA